VVAVVPFEVVLRLAVQIALPLLAAFGVVFGLAIPGVVALGRDVTAPLGELVDASRRMADGELDRAVSLNREDEFGTLGHSFERMRRSLKKQVSDMEFLVDATGDVRTGFDLEKTMPPILRNALRGTGAASVRAVLPNVRHEPYVRGEGPAAAAVAVLDRDIWRMAQHAPDKLLFLRNDGEIREHLPERLVANLPIRAIAVLPLRYGGRYNGVLWLGYRQPHELGPIERTLLDILGGQAAANADNARLYVQAEGGRRRLAAVLSNIVDAVIVTDATDRVLLLNPAMERAFRLSRRDLKQPLERVIGDEALREALLEGTERNRPVEVEAPDGRLFAAQVSDIRGVNGRDMGRVALLRDITRAREMDRLRTHFLRELAHDLGSPLTTLSGYATMLEMPGNLTAEQQGRLDEIKKSIERVDFILSDLLEKERITDGRIKRVMMSLADLLPEVVHHMEYETERKGLHLRMELGQNLPEFAADRGMIRSALVNLIDNACKYAPHSGDLLLFAERDGDHVIIGLKDNGPGVEPGQQLAIFDSFYRPDSSSSADGTGLGLSLVRTVARIHHGEAWCESNPGEGSIFYLSISLQLSVTEDSDS
jgi:PAS domain S-box-containing protein